MAGLTDALLLDVLKLSEELERAAASLEEKLRLVSFVRDRVPATLIATAQLFFEHMERLPRHHPLQMRANVALSRIGHGTMAGADLTYVPKTVEPTAFFAVRGHDDNDDHEGRAVDGVRRRRRGAPNDDGAASDGEAPASSGSERPSSSSSSSSSASFSLPVPSPDAPLSWFGPNQSPRIALAQLAAKQALEACLTMAELRRQLDSKLEEASMAEAPLQPWQ